MQRSGYDGGGVQRGGGDMTSMLMEHVSMVTKKTVDMAAIVAAK